MARIVRKKRKNNELTTLAYKMGLVERGLKNPNSQISDFYNKGINSESKPRKTLF